MHIFKLQISRIWPFHYLNSSLVLWQEQYYHSHLSDICVYEIDLCIIWVKYFMVHLCHYLLFHFCKWLVYALFLRYYYFFQCTWLRVTLRSPSPLTITFKSQATCTCQFMCKNTAVKHAIFSELCVLHRFKTAKVTFILTQGLRWAIHDFLLVFQCNYVCLAPFPRYYRLFAKI